MLNQGRGAGLVRDVNENSRQDFYSVGCFY